jgi:hypothetical protein
MMGELVEELELYRKFAREVFDEDCGLEVWERPEFEGVKLIAEAEYLTKLEERDPG